MIAGQTGERRESPRPVVRTPDPPLARPGEFARGAWRDLVRSRSLAVEMARRDVRGQYRPALVGFARAVLPVVAMTAAGLGFRSAGILNVDSVAVPYWLFVLLGIVLWTTFMDALFAPIHGLSAERRLLARAGSPMEAVVLGKLGPVAANLGVRLGLVALALAAMRHPIPWTVVAVPLGLAFLVALGTAVGLLIAPLEMVYRDVARVLAAITIFWFFFSPIYFPAPETGVIGAVMAVNPVTPLMSATRSLALTGQLDEAPQVAVAALATLLLLGFSWVYVRVALPIVLEQTNE